MSGSEEKDVNHVGSDAGSRDCEVITDTNSSLEVLDGLHATHQFRVPADQPRQRNEETRIGKGVRDEVLSQPRADSTPRKIRKTSLSQLEKRLSSNPDTASPDKQLNNEMSAAIPSASDQAKQGCGPSHLACTRGCVCYCVPWYRSPAPLGEHISKQGHTIIDEIAAWVEQQRLWLPYRGSLVRVVAHAVVDFVQIQHPEGVFRVQGTPVLVASSDAETADQFGATGRFGCLGRWCSARKRHEFWVLRWKCTGSSESQNRLRHVIPIVMLQACKFGEQPDVSKDVVLEDVAQKNRRNTTAADAHHAWTGFLDDSYLQPVQLLDNLPDSTATRTPENEAQRNQEPGNRCQRSPEVQPNGVGSVHETVRRSEEPSQSFLAKRRLDLLFETFPYLGLLREVIDHEKISDLWCRSSAMRECGGTSLFSIAYYVTGIPMEIFRLESFEDEWNYEEMANEIRQNELAKRNTYK